MPCAHPICLHSRSTCTWMSTRRSPTATRSYGPRCCALSDGDPAPHFDPEHIARMKAAGDGVWTIDGPTLAAHALRVGLVDEVEVIAAPALVGGGPPAFRDGIRTALRLPLRQRDDVADLRHEGRPRRVSCRTTSRDGSSPDGEETATARVRAARPPRVSASRRPLGAQAAAPPGSTDERPDRGCGLSDREVGAQPVAVAEHAGGLVAGGEPLARSLHARDGDLQVARAGRSLSRRTVCDAGCTSANQVAGSSMSCCGVVVSATRWRMRSRTGWGASGPAAAEARTRLSTAAFDPTVL